MIADHLRTTYGITVSGTTKIEQHGGVFLVRRADGPDWIARVFPADRPHQAVEDDAEVPSTSPVTTCAAMPRLVAVVRGRRTRLQRDAWPAP